MTIIKQISSTLSHEKIVSFLLLAAMLIPIYIAGASESESDDDDENPCAHCYSNKRPDMVL